MKRPWNSEGGDGVTVETVERTKDAADPQARRFKKGFVRLGRMPKADVVPMFGRAQVKSENEYRLAEFESAFTYIYCAYAARTRGANAIAKCFRDFAWMECFGSTWQRLILVSVSPRRREPLDVQVLVRGYAAVPEWDPTGDFALGFDESLAEDEVRVFMVQYFADHWPSQTEFYIWDELDSYVPARIRAAVDAWRRYVEDADNFTSAEGQAAYKLEASKPLKPAARVPVGRSWKSIERSCRMLAAAGASLEDFAWRICWDGCNSCDEEKETAAVADNLVRLLEWALAHGSNPNHVSLGMTCLDTLEEEIVFLERPRDLSKETPAALGLARRLRERVLAAGGKRRAEVLTNCSAVWLDTTQQAEVEKGE